MPVLSRFFHSWFSVIDRYILRELLLNAVAVTGMLILIYVATMFARYMAQAAVGDLPADVIFSLIGYSAIGALSMLLPIGTFLSVLLALGRMNTDNELTVILACGVSSWRIKRNVLLFSGLSASIVAVLSLVIVPSVLSGRYDVEQKAKMAANTSGLIAGTFKESKKGDWTFYSQGISKNKQDMENVFIEIKRKNKKTLIFRAEKGHFEIDNDNGDKYLVLDNGYRYEGDAGDQNFRIAKFATHSLLIEKGDDGHVYERDKFRSTARLWHEGTSRDIAEIQWRIATAVMTVLLGMIALPLVRSGGPRQGRFAGFFPAVLVYIFYSNLLAVTQAWVSKEAMPEWLGAVWVHILMLLMLFLLSYRQQLTQLLRRVRHKQSLAR